MAQGTVAEELVDTLARAGVERIYGIVGDSLNPVTDAIRRSQKLRWVHVRHEETAAFAAGAEAQLSDRLAACAGSCGPGNLHLINGLFDAHRSMAPVLAIASHIPSSEIGTGYFQETHPDQLFRECSHYCELISNPSQMPRALQIAMQYAVSKRGVSVIALPGDIAAAAMPAGALSHGVVGTRPVVRPGEADVDRLAELLNSAGSVTLFCGSGCAGAHDEVVALAERLKAPVGYAYRGKEWIEHDNPYEVGMSGLIGFGAAYRAMHDPLARHPAAGDGLRPDDAQAHAVRPHRRGRGHHRGQCAQHLSLDGPLRASLRIAPAEPALENGTSDDSLTASPHQGSIPPLTDMEAASFCAQRRQA